MDTSVPASTENTRTTARGWAVALLSRLQMSSVMLTSFTFGVFLPSMSQDLRLTPVEVGLLQGVWWITSALLSLPCGVWLSRFRPIPLVSVSLLCGIPFLFLQGWAGSFLVLFLARFGFVVSHVLSTPARPLLLQQWVAPRQYAMVNAVGLSQHSILLALGLSTSGLLIVTLGWRSAYMVHGGWFVLQTLAWLCIARHRYPARPETPQPPRSSQPSPLRALWLYPQGWHLGITMLALSATWTTMVTFLPTLLLQQRGIAPAVSGPLLGFLYYGLIPCALLGGWLERRVRHRKLLLWVPALSNMVFGVMIAYTTSPWFLMLLLTGVGLGWVASPVMEILPFELPGIQPREVAVIVSLVRTLSGLGFAFGPMFTGLATQLTGSLQTGVVLLCLLTGVGVIAGCLYPGTMSERIPRPVG